MINIITGKPGSGKTTYLAKMIRDFEKEKDLEIWANFAILKPDGTRDPRIHFSLDIFELLGGSHRVVFLDEAQLWFNSRDWESLPLAVQYKLQQHRHFGIDIYGAVQNLKRLDSVVRELVHHYYESSKIVGSGEPTEKRKLKRTWGLYLVREFVPEDANKKRRELSGFELFFADKKLYNSFDTHEILAPQKLENDIVQIPARICPTCHARKILK